MVRVPNFQLPGINVSARGRPRVREAQEAVTRANVPAPRTVVSPAQRAIQTQGGQRPQVPARQTQDTRQQATTLAQRQTQLRSAFRDLDRQTRLLVKQTTSFPGVNTAGANRGIAQFQIRQLRQLQQEYPEFDLSPAIAQVRAGQQHTQTCLLYTSPSPRDS